MTLSPEQQRFVDAVRTPENSHRASLLDKRFDAVPGDERLGVLLHLFSSENNYAAQQDCSRYLPEVVAYCAMPIESVLRQIASTWNLSVE